MILFAPAAVPGGVCMVPAPGTAQGAAHKKEKPS